MVVLVVEEGNEARFRESLDVDPDLNMERALLLNIYTFYTILHHALSSHVIQDKTSLYCSKFHLAMLANWFKSKILIFSKTSTYLT